VIVDPGGNRASFAGLTSDGAGSVPGGGGGGGDPPCGV